MAREMHDAVVVGGGPAGLQAAIYLGRFLRSTVVIDAGAGRSAGPQVNDNYLGFPRGVKIARLMELGRRQAGRFGVRFVEGTVSAARPDGDAFLLDGDCGEWRGRTLILATGVTDVWPPFPAVERYIGRSLFWCITCDGFRARGRRVVLIGADDESATTACQFLRFTRDLLFVDANISDGRAISAEKLVELEEQGIPVVRGAITAVVGARGLVRKVCVNGEWYDADLIFSLLGATPNSQLAARLGVLLDERGFVRVDRDQFTNVEHVFAAGDVTGVHAHQVTSAVHEGAMAAQSANYELYDDFQK